MTKITNIAYQGYTVIATLDDNTVWAYSMLEIFNGDQLNPDHEGWRQLHSIPGTQKDKEES